MESEMIEIPTRHPLDTLEDRLDELIRVCEQLAMENQSLRVRCDTLTVERDELQEQYTQARRRIEAMVARLRGLESSS
jgi:cell division protein ZapB